MPALVTISMLSSVKETKEQLNTAREVDKVIEQYLNLLKKND